MKAYLLFVAAIAAWCPRALCGQLRPLSVCEALNSVADHQSVRIRAELASTRHETYLFEGTGQDPCPGWRKRFFTAPASLPIIIGSYSGVRVSHDLFRDNLEFVLHLKDLYKTNPSAHHMVTIKGVLIRKPWMLIFRSADGSYFGFGEGIEGGSAALLVVTSPIMEDR
jgi:hypothetical protein